MLHLHFQVKRGARLSKEKFKKISYETIRKNKPLSFFVSDEKEAKLASD